MNASIASHRIGTIGLRIGALALGLLAASSLPASEPAHLTRSEEFHFGPEISASQACAKAANRLRLAAIAEVCGVRHSAVVNRLVAGGRDELAVFHLETTTGGVVAWRTLKREILPDIDDRHRCQIRAELTVRCHQGKRDPGFNTDFARQVRLDEGVYRDGDPVSLSVTATEPLYLTIYQHVPGDFTGPALRRIFPNAYQPDTRVAAGSTLTIPDGYRLDAQLPVSSGSHARPRDSFEQLFVLATRKPLQLPETLDLAGWARLLAEIPLSDRREALLGYRIVPRGDIHARSADTAPISEAQP